VVRPGIDCNSASILSISALASGRSNATTSLHPSRKHRTAVFAMVIRTGLVSSSSYAACSGFHHLQSSQRSHGSRFIRPLPFSTARPYLHQALARDENLIPSVGVTSESTQPAHSGDRAFCASCGEGLNCSARGRPRRFCSPACRNAAYRRRCQQLPEDVVRVAPGGRRPLRLRLAADSSAAA
jgi:hypothetical protein